MFERYNEWDYTHPILLWGGIFIGGFLIAFLLAIGLPRFFSDSGITTAIAGSFIATTIQIQATILAILISLTLLAVEMTASKYSARVLEIFKKNVCMWFFMLSYIISISLGSVFLLFNDSQNFQNSITDRTLFLLYLGIFLIFMLFPYVISTLEFLNPAIILKRLSRLISVQKNHPHTDPFQSFFDVIYSAIKIYDFTTMSDGLDLAESRLKEIFLQIPKDVDPNYVASHFFDDMKRCGFLLIERNEEKYVSDVIRQLLTTSQWAIEQQNSIMLTQTIRAIEELGVKAIKSQMTSPTELAIKTLQDIGARVEKNKGVEDRGDFIEILSQIVKSIGNIGEISIIYRHDETALLSIKTLGYLSWSNANSNLKYDDQSIPQELKELALICIETESPTLLRKVLDVFQSLGEFSVSKNRLKETEHILDSLKIIGKSSGEMFLNDESKQKEFFRIIDKAFRTIAYDANQEKNAKIMDIAISHLRDLMFLFPGVIPNRIKSQGDQVPVWKSDYDKVKNYIYDDILALARNREESLPDEESKLDNTDRIIRVS